MPGAALGVSADLWAVVTGNAVQIAVTALILGVVVGTRLLTGLVKRRREELSSTRRLLMSMAVAGVTVLAAVGLIAVWDRSGALADAYEAAAISDQLSNVVLAVVVLASAYALTDFLSGIVREVSAESESISKHQREVVLRLTQLTVYASALLVVVGLFTDNVGSLLVGAGFLGIVVGMAARQTLGAILAGFVIMFSRPFEVGDWVAVGDHEGTVTEVSIMSTRLRSFDGEEITLPNDTVRADPIVDRSRRSRLRIEIEVGVDYDTDIEAAIATVETAVDGVEGVAATPEPNAVTRRFDDSAVVLGVRYWIRDPSMRKRWRTQTAAMTAMKTALDDAGIHIPFPQQTLSARDTDGSGPRLDASVDGRAAPRGDGDADATVDSEANR